MDRILQSCKVILRFLLTATRSLRGRVIGFCASVRKFSATLNWAAAIGSSPKICPNEHAWQLSQELRLASNFGGPLNFSLGGNYLHYETEENYYVFINALTDIHIIHWG